MYYPGGEAGRGEPRGCSFSPIIRSGVSRVINDSSSRRDVPAREKYARIINGSRREERMPAEGEDRRERDDGCRPRRSDQRGTRIKRRGPLFLCGPRGRETTSIISKAAAFRVTGPR